MWNYNNDINRWEESIDKLKRVDYEFLKKELSSTRFYSKCLSGATYLPLNDVNNIYDILNEYEPRTWFINGSDYSNSIIPSNTIGLKPIDSNTSYEYYNKYISEYGLTLKNLFTPDRLIKDSINNFIYVDVASTEQIDIFVTYNTLIIDGIRLKDGHRLLIKDQVSNETLPIEIDPNTYFKGRYELVQDFGATIEYRYYNNENGIYIYKDKRLVKTDELNDYNNCIRYSVSVKEGILNTKKQFHISRLLNGYYPTTFLDEPIEFVEKHNWILRNRVDYNNLFEINYYDIIKNPTQSYLIDTITYSIPERTIAVGEFGIILNTQNGISNIIPNKYKVNLRSISETEKFYWICGDESTLLKIRKHDFNIEKVQLNSNYNFKSISFFNNLRGVIVGEFNTIIITIDGGITWNNLIVDDFNSFIYNKAIFYTLNKIFIIGNTGVFLELDEDISGWNIYKRRVSRYIDEFEDNILVDNINDMILTSFNSTIDWGITFSAYTQSYSNVDKEILLMVTDDSKFIVYDINNSIPNFDFIYLDFNKNYGNIKNIIRSGLNSSIFYFSTEKYGINLFDIFMFNIVGEPDNIYSNTIKSNDNAIQDNLLFVNKLFNYNDNELFICGNESLLKYSNYTSPLLFQSMDNTFENRLKSKMLFLDYDIASKLNFFTDSGEYRLPNNALFNIKNNVNNITYITSINNEPMYSYSDRSYINSYINTIKVLNAPINPKEISVKISLQQNINSLTLNLQSPNGKIINLKRSGSGVGSELNNTIFTTENINYELSSSNSPYTDRFEMDKLIGNGYSPYISNISSLSELLNNDDINGDWDLYANWGSLRTVNIIDNIDLFRNQPPILSFGPTFSQTGTFSNWEITFEYTSINEVNFEELNISKLWFEPIVVGYTNSGYSTQSYSWLDYWKDSSKTFEYYTSFDDINKILISTTFSCVDNNEIIINKNEITNDSNIIDFNRIAPGILMNSHFVAGSQSILPPITGSYSLYIGNGLIIVKVPLNYYVNKGDVIRFNSGSVDSNLVVNKILETNNNKLLYMFDTYNDSMIVDIMNSNNIKIINLNTYKNLSELEFRFNIHPISHGYLLSINNNKKELSIEALFNNITSYYNMSVNVLALDSNSSQKSEMLYTDGFLKFGYTPTYNILDYLESINIDTQPKFTPDKEYFSMPHYINIPMSGNLSFLPNQIYVDYNGILYNTYSGNSNKIYFGLDRKFEWESIFINTFVDIVIYANDGSHSTNRLLVMNKYFDTSKTIQNEDLYVIEFHKPINYTIGVFQNSIDIKSRRSLLQISNDLQEINNIQKLILSETNLGIGMSFMNLDRDINYKISSDSYAKILMSDADTISNLSAIIYTDYKNELSMNITKLDKEYKIPITNTNFYNDGFGYKLLITCQTKHGLLSKDSVILEFNGGTYSSEFLNQDYFGYHNIYIVDEFNFYIDTPYGNPTIGNDTGFVKFIKKDPFLNYQPVDIIDVGVDKRVKNSILLEPENISLKDDIFSLINVNYNKYRFRLVDGLTIEEITLKFSWILEAEIKDAIIGKDINGIIWYKGIWECGRWFGGTWISGTWMSGDWYDGIWESKEIIDNLISIDINSKSINISQSTWISGRWYNGVWNNGRWYNGRWYNGVWNNGTWYKGIWNDGIWNDGNFEGGVWINGLWNQGIFNCNNDPSFWLDGKWKGGDFENGIWYNGIFEEANGLSRFGTNAYNSRTANWYGGQWIGGSFYSNFKDDDVATSHIYSIWKTGSWYNGDWHGGIAYNIDFKSGVWHGGILEEIQIVGFNNNFITLNGIFRFNIGDEIVILSPENSIYTDIAKYDDALIYKVLKSDVDMLNNRTNLYLNLNINSSDDLNEVDTTLRLVSRFRNSNWKSGIWSNGYYESGVWEGGIWYNGLFKAKWM